MPKIGLALVSLSWESIWMHFMWERNYFVDLAIYQKNADKNYNFRSITEEEDTRLEWV